MTATARRPGELLPWRAAPRPGTPGPCPSCGHVPDECDDECC
jgi:hypothetical protein